MSLHYTSQQIPEAIQKVARDQNKTDDNIYQELVLQNFADDSGN